MTSVEKNEQQKNSFLTTSSYEVLRKLAQHPIDLTAEGILTQERLNNFSSEAVGFQLLYGTDRVDEKVMQGLFQLANDCNVVKKMHQMQAGEHLNKINGYPSENRQALHTATRDFFGSPDLSVAAKDAKEKALTEIEKLKSFLKEIDRHNQFTDAVIIGIGGSYLGPEAIYLALKAWGTARRRLHFLANVDPDEACDILDQVSLKQTLFLIVSKSGSTLETLTNCEMIKARMKQEGINAKEHFIAITEKGSQIDQTKDFRQVFYIWDWIGGRYSSTSMVGGVALSLTLGFDVYWKFLEGAHAMDRVALDENPETNLPLLGALLGIWNHNFLKCQTLAVVPYCHALRRFPAHLQQLDMESNGKLIDKNGESVQFQTGPIVWGEVGTNGQHSFFQLLHQGTHQVSIDFVGFQNNQLGDDLTVKGTTSQEKLLSNLFAQSIALATGKSDDNPNKSFPGNRPSRILLAKQLTPYTLGALLSYYEHLVAFQGFIWNINSFDQEGVQLGKVLANRIMDRFRGKGLAFSEADFYINRLDRCR